MIKQELFTVVFLSKPTISNRFIFWFLLLIALVTMILLPSFSNPKPLSSSSILPFSKTTSFEPTTISCKINNAIVKGFYPKEANLFKMEQAEGVFAKVVNMSLADGDGNLFALSLTDLENAKMDSCLTSTIFYGNEHESSDRNFSNDIGNAVFANNSNLIFENSDGVSLISRDGWIKIDRCDNRRISGSYNFKLKKKNTTEVLEGEFVNVLLKIE